MAVVAGVRDRDLEVAGAVDSWRRRSQRAFQSNNRPGAAVGKGRREYEELVIPDDTHHFMRHTNLVKVDAAVAAFFDRVFGMNRGSE